MDTVRGATSMKSAISGVAVTQRQKPSCAIVFYTQESSKEKESTYATYHPVRPDGEKFQLSAGQPLTGKNLAALAKVVAKGLKHQAEILPGNVLVANEKLIVWWTPAALHEMSFDISTHGSFAGRTRLQGVGGKVPCPALVFMLNRDKTQGRGFTSIRVFALAENARPDATTSLFRAPLLNVNETGDVCWGNAVRPTTCLVTDIPAWQALFFSSVFTHFNGSQPIQCEDTYAFIADLLEQQATEFPQTALMPNRFTLQSVVNSSTGA